MATKTIGQIVAAAKGTSPWYEFFNSLAEYVQTLQADVSALSAGGTPGFDADIDRRWYAVDAGAADAISITPQQSASGETLSAGLWYAIKIVADNTGATTLDVGSTEGAVAVNKVDPGTGLQALSGAELTAGMIYIFQYEATAAKWVVLNPDVEVQTAGINILSVQTGDYTLQAGDVTGYKHVVIPFDISGATRTLTVPDSSTFRNIIIEPYISTDAGETSSNVLTVEDDAGTPNEIGTYYLEGHGARFISTGAATYNFLYENVRSLYKVVLEADDSLSSSTNEKVFDVSVDAKKNPGGLYDITTNYRFDAPFDCELRVGGQFFFDNNDDVAITPRISGTNVIDLAGLGDAAQAGPPNTWIHHLFPTAGQYIEFQAYELGGFAATLYGDAAEDESYVFIEMVRRIR